MKFPHKRNILKICNRLDKICVKIHEKFNSSIEKKTDVLVRHFIFNNLEFNHYILDDVTDLISKELRVNN
jgi:hypothetical protein